MAATTIDFNQSTLASLQQSLDQGYTNIIKFGSANWAKAVEHVVAQREALLTSELALTFFSKWSEFQGQALNAAAQANKTLITPAQQQITVITKQVTDSPLWKDYKVPLLLAAAAIVIGVASIIYNAISDKREHEENLKARRVALKSEQDAQNLKAFAQATEKLAPVLGSEGNDPETLTRCTNQLIEIARGEKIRATKAEADLTRSLRRTLAFLRSAAPRDDDNSNYKLLYTQSALDLLLQLARSPEQTFSTGIQISELLTHLSTSINTLTLEGSEEGNSDLDHIKAAIAKIQSELNNYETNISSLSALEQMIVFTRSSSPHGEEPSLENTISRLKEIIPGSFEESLHEAGMLTEEGEVEEVSLKQMKRAIFQSEDGFIENQASTSIADLRFLSELLAAFDSLTNGTDLPEGFVLKQIAAKAEEFMNPMDGGDEAVTPIRGRDSRRDLYSEESKFARATTLAHVASGKGDEGNGSSS